MNAHRCLIIEQHFVLGARGQSCHSLTPFVLKERGLKRHFQQTPLVVVERGLNCCDQTSYDEERGLICQKFLHKITQKLEIARHVLRASRVNNE
ncbi:hypothetical protein Tco_0394970 [Tanacetum coccineum]